MAITQTKSKRKPSGGRLGTYRKKRVHELGSSPVKTEIGSPKRAISRGKGGVKKQKATKNRHGQSCRKRWKMQGC